MTLAVTSASVSELGISAKAPAYDTAESWAQLPDDTSIDASSWDRALDGMVFADRKALWASPPLATLSSRLLSIASATLGPLAYHSRSHRRGRWLRHSVVSIPSLLVGDRRQLGRVEFRGLDVD